ncbi:isoaspartyl peptidase/L-asparaginase family protein [Longibacter sp.]|jgi:beta-aspartyl-peptidase (threonine type)|uniref:isoaspartyl peptidase/L-asparaginase family protein n=1 Tax=Longibacter sp. TaxID=2045415 RepID=UPI003EB9163E
MPDGLVFSASFAIDGPVILVHGGAWDIPDGAVEDHRDGLKTALAAGRRSLASGHSAVDVAADVVASMESHGAFDAGRGAMLNQDGRAQLDAGIMDGSCLDYGAVIAVERLKNPIRVARRLMDAGNGQVRILAGEGAERFAVAEAFTLIDNVDLISERERDRFEALRDRIGDVHTSQSFLPGVADRRSGGGHDTVGCVVRDARGHVAAATSTGGTPFKPPGRVGDSPLPGSGFYADGEAAVSCTGWGEAIAAVVLAHDVVRRILDDEDLELAMTSRLQAMHDRIRNPDGDGARGGLIALSGSAVAWAYSTPRMARAIWAPGLGTVHLEL